MYRFIFVFLCILSSFSYSSAGIVNNSSDDFYTLLQGKLLMGLKHGALNEKYYLDFETNCYGGTPGISFDFTHNHIFIFDQSTAFFEKEKTVKKERIFKQFDIINVENVDGSYSVSAALQDVSNLNNKIKPFVFKISLVDGVVIKIEVDKTHTYFESNPSLIRYLYYVSFDSVDKFEKTDCEDFDG